MTSFPLKEPRYQGTRDHGAQGSNKGTKGEGEEGERISGEEGLPTPFPPPPPPQVSYLILLGIVCAKEFGIGLGPFDAM